MSQPTQKKTTEKGNLFFNKRGLAWFGLDGLEDDTGTPYSLTFSPFSGWGDDELPEHLKSRKVLTAEEMLGREDDKVERITGKRPQRGVRPTKLKSIFFTPKEKSRKPNLLKASPNSKYIIKFNLFDTKVQKFGAIARRKEAQEFLDLCVERRDLMYSVLKVKTGQRDYYFREYIITGSEYILETLKSKYPK